MADLRDLLQQAAPTPPDFDEASLRRAFAQRTFRRRALLTAGAGAVAAAIAVAIGISASRDTEKRTLIVSPSSTTASTTATSVPAVADDVRWRALPAAPIEARAGAASAWTGSAFVVWGGRDGSFRALSDGAWYDPHAQRWHSMGASPLGPAVDDGRYVGVPLGSDAMIVSGTKAAAYTPTDDSWRVLPDVPLSRVEAAALAMPGAPPRVVVSGVHRDGQPAFAWLDAADTGSWHTVAMREGARRVVLLASGHIVYWYGQDQAVDVDPSTGAEHMIPAQFASEYPAPYPFDPYVMAGSLAISPLAQVAWDATTGSYEDLSSRTTGATGATASGYCSGAWAWTGRELLTWGGTECQGDSYLDAGAEYVPSSGALRPLPKFLSGRTGMAFAWTGTELLIWGGQTDSNGHVVGDGASLTFVPTSTSTTTVSTEPSPPRDGFPVDPTAYIRERDYEDVARAGEVELPTWLPAWAGAAKPIVIAVPPFSFETAWINPDGVDPTTGEEVRIDVNRGREPSHDDALPWELPPQTIQGTTRTYHTLYGDTCPPKGVIRDGPVLWWRVPGYTYSVSVYPWPGCAPGFSIRDAVMFADSLVPCRVNADSLECSTKPS